MKKTTLAFLLVFGPGTVFSHAKETNTDFNYLHGAEINKTIEIISASAVAAPSAPSIDKSTHSAEGLFNYNLKREYTYQNLAERDGKAAARKLKTAGYKILAEKVRQNDDGTWGYSIEYATPPDASSETVKTYCLAGLNDYRYTYQNLAEADGRAVVAKLQAARYIILEQRVQMENGYWSCYIEYLPPAGVSAG